MTFTFDVTTEGDQVVDQVPAEKPAPVAFKPFDIEAAKSQFEKYRVQIGDLMKLAVELEVEDDATAKIAVDMGGTAHQMIKALESEMAVMIKDPDGFVKSVRAFVKSFTSQLAQVKAAAKRKLETYTYHQEQERRKAEAAARAEQARRQAELDAAAKANDIAPVKLPEMVAPKKKQPIRSSGGTASTRMKWTHEIEDPSKVPAEYLIPDAKAIQSAVDAGIRDIAGVRIFEKPIVSFR